MSKNTKALKYIIGVVAAVCLVALIVVTLKGMNKSNSYDNSAVNDMDATILESDSDDSMDSSAEKSHADILDEGSEAADEGEQILYIPKDEVYSFSMTDANGILLTFERQDQEWVYVDDTSLDISEDRIDKILNYITDIHFIDSFTADSGEDYGLTQDSPVYVLTDSSGYSTYISIGNTDEASGNVYFAINYDFDNIYINSGKLKNIGSYSVEELIAL